MHNPIFHDISNRIYTIAKRGIAVILTGVMVMLMSLGTSGAAAALTEDQRLLNEVWRIIDRAYVDASFNHQNWWAVREKYLKKNMPDREATYQLMREMLGLLGDPFTRVMNPEQYRSLQTSTSGELTGVGLQIALDADRNVLKVMAPIAGSPAEKAGIQPGDEILEIDGKSTVGVSLDDAAGKMRGKLGTVVILKILHDGGPEREYDLVRDRIELNPVTSELRTTEKHRIGYIRLTQFNANAQAEVTSAITSLEKQNVDRYILDLRNNPGGLLQAGIDIAKLWIHDGPIVYTVNRQGELGSYYAEQTAVTNDPMVVLVNKGTASASEILAGALQDNQRAILIGEKTFGKGLIQSLFNLSDGSGLAVTVARYETPNHNDINKLGITPDRIVELGKVAPKDIGKDSDPQYRAAIEFLETIPDRIQPS
jgi:carboxyl-terminal processing protease